MHKNCVQNKSYSKCYVPALGGVSPDKELEAVSAILVGVFHLIEPQLFLHVESAVVPIE